MNSKGQLGQIVTSFPVLLILLIIMILFFVISGTISAFGGADKSFSNYGIEEINSRVLLEMFLGDFVIIEDKQLKVETALEQQDLNEIKELIQQKFHEKYGCNSQNKLQIYDAKYVNKGGGQGVTIKEFYLYVDYPETLDNLVQKTSSDSKIILFEKSSEKKLKNNLKILTKGNVKC